MGFTNPLRTQFISPGRGIFAITPGASPLFKTTRGIYAGGSGDITVTMKDGTSGTFVGVAAGVVLPIQATHVTAATATSLVGVY